MDIFTIIIILIIIVISFYIGQKIGEYRKHREWELALPEHRKDAIAQSRAVLSGQFSEQLSPFLPDFPFSPTECRFIGKPLDFIVFKGADKKQIDEVVFVEVKSGKSTLSKQEKNLKDTIKNKRVSWYEYHVPDDVTRDNNSEK